LRQVDPGNIVHASDANGLVIITQLQPISVLFTIPEDNLPQILKKLRAGASLTVEAYNRDKSEKLDTCKLLTVDNAIDPQTGTSKLKAVCDNANHALFPNQFVNVRLLVDRLANQVLIPEAAVQQGANGPFVYVVGDDAKVKVTPIQTGITENSLAQVLSGVNDAEAVVTDGADKLQNGSRVRIREIGTGRGGRGRGKKGAPTGSSTPPSAETVNAPPATTPMSGSETGGGQGEHKEGRKGKKNQ
jgi:multidrug efflux system membrane fusion protein